MTDAARIATLPGTVTLPIGVNEVEIPVTPMAGAVVAPAKTKEPEDAPSAKKMMTEAGITRQAVAAPGKDGLMDRGCHRRSLSGTCPARSQALKATTSWRCSPSATR